MAGVAIKVDKVSKSFDLPHEKQGSIKNAFVNIFRGKRTIEKQEVLQDVSFEIKEGEFFGIVGRNGSGKSTLLKLLAGVYSPNEGAIHINGKLTPFIELGVGFNPELTGRENVYLNGALLGFSRKEMEALYDEIVGFAELERFMDQKLKNYSSGMQVRLAFSIAIRARSEILLLDEVLAVGDALFQKKCYDYFKLLKKEKRTVVFVSHDTNALLEYCDSGILINQGKLIKKDKINGVVNAYLDILSKEQDRQFDSKKDARKEGSGKEAPIVVSDARSFGSDGKNRSIFNDEDKTIDIKVTYTAKSPVENPIFGITIMDAGGMRVFSSNTLWSKLKTPNVKKGQKLEVNWTIPNAFNTGTFSVTPAAADSSGAISYDVAEDELKFQVNKKLHSISFINIDHKIEVN